MNSITNVIVTTYGQDDEPEPSFQCPVVIDPQVLAVLHRARLRVGSIVQDAASAVALVNRFERNTRYVDFAPRLSLVVGVLPVAMRVQLVRGHLGLVARIEFSGTD